MLPMAAPTMRAISDLGMALYECIAYATENQGMPKPKRSRRDATRLS